MSLPPTTASAAAASLPSLAEAARDLAPLRTLPPQPPVLHQFWDRDPPRQITQLLRHNAKLCRRWGIGHEIWDHAQAETFLATHWPRQLALYRAAPHPAMASDLLRLCILHHHGGLWLDADMALRADGGARLPGLLHEVLVFKWNQPDRSNLPNWCFGFRAGHPALAVLIDATAAAMEQALAHDPRAALRGILDVSGPGRFTRVLGGWIATHGCPPGLLMLDVAEAYRMVQNGPELLRAPLDYKKTARHWLVAGRG